MSKLARVVLVEPDAEMRGVVRLRLQLDGFDVVAEMAHAKETIDALDEGLRCHVIVTDLDFDHLAELRDAAPTSALVVFSWFADSCTLAELLRLGVDAYVDKVGGPTRLSAHLRSVLAHPSFGRPAPPSRLDDPDRLAHVRDELARLTAVARVRALNHDEQQRVRRLLLLESRLELARS